ncbi:peptidase M1, membrane alanine aminopeptidase [Desulfovibrio sp. X2]|uniref:M1 family metallopeptidase n=1 Tax=Desulfovibrio sp. X2 TaxID=941449 RepID=UPI000358A4FC|nr:M1 family aminopeptidase [Desulfovibrio sp. X2]EPR37446.1 peptidase M1, membrane alanine aminopeptidase [Desulfovibrio sp. X2]
MRLPISGRVLCLALLVFCCSRPAAADVVSADHDLSVRLFPAGHRLEAVDTLRLEITDESSLFLALSGDAQVSSLTLDGRATRFVQDGDMLYLHLPPERRTGRITVAVTYSAVFNDAFDTRPLSVDNPGQGVEGAITDKGAFLLPGCGWYPEIEADRRAFRITVRAPRGMYAVTQGRLVGHEDQGEDSISTWQADKPVEGLALCAGRYVVGRTRSGDTDVYAYFTSGDRDLMNSYLETAARDIDFYRELFGPYPFEKFAVVENFFPTGYGFPSYTVLGGSILRLPFILDTSLMHEIAHCWWGNGVLVDPEEGNWSEGLATYVADYLTRERKSPSDARDYRLGVLRDYASLAAGERDFPLSAFGSRNSPASQVIGYGKGMFVFHMIRRHIGDAAFWKGLRTLARERMFKAVTWDDFRETFERVSGWNDADSRTFFAQWIDRAGAPILTLGRPSVHRRNGEYTVKGEISQGNPVYSLELPVSVQATAGGQEKTESRTVDMDDEHENFALEVQGQPKRLTVDPDADVFRLLPPEEVPPTVNSVRGAGRLVVVLSRSFASQWRDACGSLLTALGRRGDVPVREERTDAYVGRGESVLFCGYPETAAWRARLGSLPAGLKLSPGSFSMNGVTSGTGANSGADTLFTVLPSPARDGSFTAGFFPAAGASPQALLDAVRKIPHYGKYSYLAFKDGVNELKGTFEPSSSSLSVALSEAQ